MPVSKEGPIKTYYWSSFSGLILVSGPTTMWACKATSLHAYLTPRFMWNVGDFMVSDFLARWFAHFGAMVESRDMRSSVALVRRVDVLSPEPRLRTQNSRMISERSLFLSRPGSHFRCILPMLTSYLRSVRGYLYTHVWISLARGHCNWSWSGMTIEFMSGLSIASITLYRHIRR